MNGTPPLPRRHLLTVALEDYYHVGAFNSLIQRGHWYRFESRLEQNTRRSLDLLDQHGVRATFFTLGWVADALPELVREVAGRGHEIANRGYYHRSIQELTPEEFRQDLSRSKEALERAAGRRVIGYRVADRWLGPADLWALDVLAEEGYEYDSSIGPVLRAFSAEPWRRFAHPHPWGERLLWEFPISALAFLGWMLPISGGNYLRQFPRWLMRRAVAHWTRTYAAPLVLYFHVWELDPDQPRIGAASALQRIRHYRNLRRMPEILGEYLNRYRFSSIADHLGVSTALRPAAPAPAARKAEPPVPARPRPRAPGRTPVTVVIPCYNEERTLPYLANTLASVERRLGDAWELHFLFVDDASVDGTWESLQRLFGSRPGCRLERHQRNLGVAAAILTGIRAADTDIVASIDCDCTYDPHELAAMIPLLTAGVDLVTASPYHPQGRVHNIPAWRLFLSRRLSGLYRLVLRRPLHTWTSCFRVYRRATLTQVRLRESGFLGVAETLGILVLSERGVVEFPATLEVRVLGRSKMKVLRTIAGHFRLLARLALARAGGWHPLPPAHPAEPAARSERERLGV